MLWCIENANINIQSKLHVPAVICLELQQKPKSIYSKTDFCKNSRFPLIFLLFAFKNYWEIFTFDPSKYQLDSTN